MAAFHVKGLFVVLFGSVLAFPVVQAEDKKEPVPPKVMDALKARFSKAVIDKCTKEKEGDAVVYDIEFKQGKQKFEADIKADGTILNWEKEIAIKDLPDAARKAVDRKYPNATLKEVMQVTEAKDGKDRLEGYEITLQTAAKKSVEVTVAPDGKILEDSGEKKK